jgi:integrase
MRLTRTAVANLKLAEGKPYRIFWDDGLPGFGVRVNPANKVWVVQYRAAGKSRRETIGRVETVPLEVARGDARRKLAQVQLGGDPYEERAKAKAARSLLLENVVEKYLHRARDRLKPRSFQEVERHLRKHWEPLHRVPITALDRSSIAARLEEIAQQNGPVASNRARAALSALLSYGLGTGLLEANPIFGTFKAGEEIHRDRVLTDQELCAVWNACDNSDYGRIVRLLTLTGQRRDEVGSMRWSDHSRSSTYRTCTISCLENSSVLHDKG